MFDASYERQTQLLLSILPALEAHACFALKGGTAINLFVQDLPRVSVDIDLTYLTLMQRNQSVNEISENLRILAHSHLSGLVDARVREHRRHGYLIRAVIETPTATIKIEPNTIFRGSVYPAEERDVVETAQQRFGMYVRARTLSMPGLYGGKLCAALDRHPPRDRFEVKLLLGRYGITPRSAARSLSISPATIDR